ncbi:hypothetical protein Y032_0076g1007 [Ancylostoma ceylanicum]|uniref:Uncharacterized protein n=1 Tax=Ancylostoma ceylanicum TaxID=53326 RepID=A0A016TTG6_9BILA|nr:hypothetical protein Y032_0076g1007 [Ancylostoma ceylanicum]
MYSRSKKYSPLPSTARLLSRAAPPMHYHTCCDVAQSTRSIAGGRANRSRWTNGLFCFHPSPQVTFSTIKPLNTTAQWMWGYRLVIHSVVF